MKKALSVLIALTIFFAFSGAVFASYAEDITDEILSLKGGIEALKMSECGAGNTQAWLDTGLAETAGQGGDWYILALYDKGYDMTAFRSSLNAYIAGNSVPSATTNLKLALISVAVGGSLDYAEKSADEYIGGQGVMSLIFGLHLLSNGVRSTAHTKEEVIGDLLSAQLPDGGWALFGEYGDSDVTAMTVQALSPYYNTDENVKSAVDTALSLLSEKQLDDGDYSSFGKPNLESTAQVLAALSSLGIDFSADERFIKNGNTLLDGMKKYLLENGGFSHENDGKYNATATVQAYYCLDSYLRMKEGKRLYIFEQKAPETEAAEEENPTVTEAVSEPEITTATVPEISSAQQIQQVQQIQPKTDYKPVALIVVLGVGIAACAVLFIAGKHNAKNFIFVAVIAGAASAFILLTSFSTADEYYTQSAKKENVIGTVTFSVSVGTIVGEKNEYIPADGFIIPAEKLDIASGETVRDILVEAVKAHGVQLDISSDGYVRGIGYIYEFDYGDLSGWMYHVNGEAPSVNCGGYELSDGDVVEWLYTRNIGLDLN